MSARAVTLAVALVVAVALHLVNLASLAARSPWRAALALVVPPLAPYWCWQFGMIRRAGCWWLAAIAYALVRATVGS